MDEQLPEGWTVTGTDREVFRLHDAEIVTWAAMADGPDGSAMVVVASEHEPDAIVAACAASAVGRSGEAVMAMGIGEANAILQLVRALRGDLAVAEAWAPIL